MSALTELIKTTLKSDNNVRRGITAIVQKVKDAQVTSADIQACTKYALANPKEFSKDFFPILSSAVDADCSAMGYKNVPTVYLNYLATMNATSFNIRAASSITHFASANVDTLNFNDLVTLVPTAVTGLTNPTSTFVNTIACRLLHTQWTSPKEAVAAAHVLSLRNISKSPYAAGLAAKLVHEAESGVYAKAALGKRVGLVATARPLLKGELAAKYNKVTEGDATEIQKFFLSKLESPKFMSTLRDLVKFTQQMSLPNPAPMTFVIDHFAQQALKSATPADRRAFTDLAATLEEEASLLTRYAAYLHKKESALEGGALLPAADAVPVKEGLTQSAQLSHYLRAASKAYAALADKYAAVVKLPFTDETAMYGSVTFAQEHLRKEEMDALKPALKAAKEAVKKLNKEMKEEKKRYTVLVGVAVEEQMFNGPLRAYERLVQDKDGESFLPRVMGVSKNEEEFKLVFPSLETASKDISMEERIRLSIQYRAMIDSKFTLKAEEEGQEGPRPAFHVAIARSTKYSAADEAFVGKTNFVDLNNQRVVVRPVGFPEQLNFEQYRTRKQTALMIAQSLEQLKKARKATKTVEKKAEKVVEKTEPVAEKKQKKAKKAPKQNE